MIDFQCQRCGACCKQPGFVYLKEGDAERLAAHLGMDIYQFTETYCLLMDRQHLALKKHPDETCLFLGAEGCTVYEARPRQCRDFPHGWKTERSLDYCEGLRKK
jgi:hypothetical protein